VLQAKQSNSKEAAKFDTVFREYLAGREIVNFTDDPPTDNDALVNCDLSIYSNRRQAENHHSHASSMHEELFTQTEDTNVFADFEELLSEANSKQFRTYDNSRRSNHLIADACSEPDCEEQISCIDYLNMRLEQVGKTTINRCSSRITKPAKQVAAARISIKAAQTAVLVKPKAKMPGKPSGKSSTMGSIAQKYAQKPVVCKKAKPSTPDIQLVESTTPSLIRQQIDRLMMYTAQKQRPKAQPTTLT
jgi:hypothetical protein